MAKHINNLQLKGMLTITTFLGPSHECLDLIKRLYKFSSDWRMPSFNNIGFSSLSFRFNGHFPGEPGWAGVYWSKGWWRWWWQLDYWSYKSCKAPVKSSPPTNLHPVFLQAGCPSCHPTNSVKALKGNITFHGLAYPNLTWGFQLCLWPLIAPGYFGWGLCSVPVPSRIRSPYLLPQE